MSLPPELYRPIIQHVDAREDLYRLLFVSRLVSYEAERTLYHAIHTTLVLSRLMALLFHLAQCQRVARHVQELGIHGRIAREEVPGLRHVWYSFNKALCMLPNLRVLNLSMQFGIPDEERGHLHTTGGHFYAIPDYIFSNCTFKLEILMLTSYYGKSFSHLDLAQLKELRLDMPTTYNMPKQAFPSLQILSTSAYQFSKFCYNNNEHRIKALELLPDGESEIGLKFTNITSLKFYSWPVCGVDPFPSLRYIYATVTNKYMPLPLSFLAAQLSTLKSLEKLCLDTNDYPAFLHVQFFSAIPSLQELEIVHGPHEVKRWNRDGKDPVDIPRVFSEDEWKNPWWL